MQTYILSIAGVVLISAVISIVAPVGKMGKFVKGMTKLFILVVLIAPFASWAGGNSYIFTTSELGSDEGYLLQYTQMLSSADEREIAAWLDENYGISAEVTVSRSIDDFRHENILVEVKDFGINGQDSHIDILSEIKEQLEKNYGCSAEVS